MTAKIKTVPKHTGHRYKPRGMSDKAFSKVYWPYIPVILIIGILISFSTSTGAFSSIVRHPDGKVLSYATSMSINGLLADTNTARAQNGVSGLTLNSQLDAAAQAKANDMASRNYWSHNTPEGNPPWIFVSSQGYSYQKLGENLAAGFNDEQSTINGWMGSPPHRANMLDSAFTDVGFGFANNPDYTSAGGGPMTVVVAFYGKPQVLAQQTTAPPAGSTKPTSSTPVAAPTAPTSAPESTPASQEDSQTLKTEQTNSSPATSDNNTSLSPKELLHKSSRAQVALGNISAAKFGTTLAVIIALAAIGIWLSRHALAIRHAFANGEKFVIKHPLMDVGLLVIAALSFLLTQTAGFIQ